MPRGAAFRVLGLTALLALSARAEPPAPEMEILRRVASSYRDASTTWLEGTIEAQLRGPAGGQSTEAAFRLALGERGKVRDELQHPAAGAMRVSDGTQTWLYMAPLQQYTRQPAGAGEPEGGPVTGLLLATLQSLDRGVESVRALPDESVPYQGEDRLCHVLEVVHQPSPGVAAPKVPRRFWIDRQRGVVLRQSAAVTGEGAVEQRETVRYTRVLLGRPLPDSLFAFRPPPGARRVEEFGRSAGDLTGRTAADFTLPDLGGRRHSLSRQRGKVVMLDFWASWCGPCRVQMPMVEKLHHELKDKGLVVYAINQGESAEIARRYLARHRYSTTTLLDPSTEVGRNYQVAGIPTLVIIDRQGKIAAHYVGVRSEAVLRDALKRAGL
jgi:thiol-disulfide isomerase/thioredoxin